MDVGNWKLSCFGNTSIEGDENRILQIDTGQEFSDEAQPPAPTPNSVISLSTSFSMNSGES